MATTYPLWKSFFANFGTTPEKVFGGEYTAQNAIPWYTVMFVFACIITVILVSLLKGKLSEDDLKQIGNATLAAKGNGTGTIALETLGDARISYLVCWPHVRPWHLAKSQPALRCIPDAAAVAKLLADAAETRVSQPQVTLVTPRLGMAAAE